MKIKLLLSTHSAHEKTYHMPMVKSEIGLVMVLSLPDRSQGSYFQNVYEIKPISVFNFYETDVIHMFTGKNCLRSAS